MKRFSIEALKEGDILCGRNMVSKDGAMIRAILGSTTNHNALIVRHNTKGWGIGDMFPPKGVFMPFKHYENLIADGKYMVRVLRIKDAHPGERHLMSHYWQLCVDKQPYSKIGLYRLWVMRVVNSLPYHIKGTWCTRAVGLVVSKVFDDDRNIFRKLFVEGMPIKKNETPRTVENRLVQGLLVDVTDEVLIEV